MDVRLRESDTDRSQTEGAPEGDVLLDFDKMLAAVRRQRWVVAVWVILGVLLGLVHLATTPPSYRATANVLLVGEQTRQTEQLGAPGNVTPAYYETTRQILGSQALALRVAEMLDLGENDDFLQVRSSLATRVVESARSTVKDALDKLAPAPERTGGGSSPAPESRAAARREAAANLLIQYQFLDGSSRSGSVQIGIELYDPVLAARIANTYTEAYTADQLETSFETTGRITEFLQQRLAELEADARQAALEAELFRADSGLVGTGDRLLTESNLNQFSGELSLAQADAARARALVSSYDAALARGPEALIGEDGKRQSLTGDVRYGAMEQILSDLTARRAEVVRNFGQSHPQVAALDAQMADQAERLYAELERQVEVARGESNLADARVTSLSEAIVPLVDANSDALRSQIEYRLLLQRADSLSGLYQEFLSQFQQADQFRLFPAGQIRVLSPAGIPQDASAPSAQQVLALGLVFGLMAGLAHMVIRERRERFLRNGPDVSNGLGARFLGYLPILTMQGRQRAIAKQGDTADYWPTLNGLDVQAGGTIDYPLAHLVLPRSRYSETLHVIRNAAGPSLTHGNGTIIGVTSLLPGEGKSTVAADLAGVLSIAAGRVLLVDADPRHAGLSKLLDLPPDADLMLAISRQVDWKNCRTTITGTKVDVLGWASPVTSIHPTEILASREMQDILESAAKEYNSVIVDLGPLEPVVDAHELFYLIDQFVMVSQWGRTPKVMMRETLRDEPALAAKLLGVVFSRVDMRKLKNFTGPEHRGADRRFLTAYFRQ